MNPRNLTRLALLAVVGGSIAVFATRQMRDARAEVAPASAAVLETAAGNHVVMTYFTTNVRCTSCRKIEQLSRETAEVRHAGDLARGRLVFRIVNTDEPGMGHFVEHYQLTSKTVILSRIEDGREVAWKDMGDVWKHFGEPEVFHAYLGEQITLWAGQ
jgi:hypothetical protein